MSRDDTYLLGNQFAAGNGPNRTSFRPGNAPWNGGRMGEYRLGWARKWRACDQCGTTESPHAGRGLCVSCYVRAEAPKKIEEKHARTEEEYRTARLVAVGGWSP